MATQKRDFFVDLNILILGVPDFCWGVWDPSIPWQGVHRTLDHIFYLKETLLRQLAPLTAQFYRLRPVDWYLFHTTCIFWGKVSLDFYTENLYTWTSQVGESKIRRGSSSLDSGSAGLLARRFTPIKFVNSTFAFPTFDKLKMDVPDCNRLCTQLMHNRRIGRRTHVWLLLPSGSIVAWYGHKLVCLCGQIRSLKDRHDQTDRRWYSVKTFQ